MHDAITLMKRDHKALREAYKNYKTAKGESEKNKWSDEIFVSLSAHAKMEERFFYPALRKEGGMNELIVVAEAAAEHAGVKVLVKALQSLPSGAIRDKGVDQLMKLVEHHVQEEEKEMFLLAKKILGSELIKELGERMEPFSPSGLKKK